MNAQETAKANAHAHGAYDDQKMTFTHPSKHSGYGLVLIALSTLPKHQRKTQIQVAKIIGRPIRISTSASCINGEWILKPTKYFSTHSAWASLSNAKLIEKADGAWTLTQLGKNYMKEMNLA